MIGNFPTFNPANWYWIVSGSTTQVYSSARNIYVGLTDPAYTAWLAAGNSPSSIAQEADIWYYVGQLPNFPSWLFNGTSFSQPAAGQYTKAQLTTYANIKQWALATGGYTTSVGGTPLKFDTSTIGQSLLSGKVLRLNQPNPPTIINWQFGSTFVAISATNFDPAATAVADFVQATFDTLKAVEAAIAAGTITTIAQVDSPPAPTPAWPVNS